jgi:GNAT superfamily N-acetyltransferase
MPEPESPGRPATAPAAGSAAAPVELRPARHGDIEAITAIWHRGWRDGHLGNVPDALVRHRRFEDFRALVPPRIPATTVAVTEAGVVGFVTVHGDEVEQVYVDAAARGTGVAAALLTHAEAEVATRADRAWLAVVAGNARARRFYERQGWEDAGPLDYQAENPEGGTIKVPVHRYEKRLTLRP